jgi:hypothetical protein
VVVAEDSAAVDDDSGVVGYSLLGDLGLELLEGDLLVEAGEGANRGSRWARAEDEVVACGCDRGKAALDTQGHL